MPEDNKGDNKDYGKDAEKVKESLRDVARLLGQASSIVSAIVGAGYSASASYYKTLEDEVKAVVKGAADEVAKCVQALTELKKKETDEAVEAEVSKRVDAQVAGLRKELASLKELYAGKTN